MMMRNKEFKPAKGYHPVEFYLNDPSETAPQDLITDVSSAIKYWTYNSAEKLRNRF